MVKALKRCIELLTQFRSSVPNPQGRQEMLDVFQKAIEVEERIVEDRIEKGNGCRMETKRKIILALK